MIQIFTGGSKFVSVKALKGYATESSIVASRMSSEFSDNLLACRHLLPGLLDASTYSTTPGKVSIDCDHLCIVTDLTGGDVRSLVRGPENPIFLFRRRNTFFVMCCQA